MRFNKQGTQKQTGRKNLTIFSEGIFSYEVVTEGLILLNWIKLT